MRTGLIAAGMLMVAGAGAAHGASLVLGPASDFNVFTFGSANLVNSDIQGRAAFGGNVTLQNYGVGSGLAGSGGTRDDLVGGGMVTWTNGQVFSGNLLHAGAASLSGVGTPQGTIYQASSPINFVQARNELIATSAALFSTGSTGATSTTPWGALTLTGAGAGPQFFSVTAAQLSSATSLTISTAPATTVIINVSGSTASMQNFQFFMNGASAGKVLFNFAEATQLTLAGIGVKGSVLAPNAAVSFNNGHIDGQMIANTIAGSGEFHHVPFEGAVILVPLPAQAWSAIALLAGVAGYRRLRTSRAAV